MYRTSEKILLHFKTSLKKSLGLSSVYGAVFNRCSLQCTVAGTVTANGQFIKSQCYASLMTSYLYWSSFSASWTSDLRCLSHGWYFHRGEGSLLLRVHLVRLITWHMLLTTKAAVCFMLIVWLVSFAKIIPCDCADWLWRVLGPHSHFTALLQWEDGNYILSPPFGPFLI